MSNPDKPRASGTEAAAPTGVQNDVSSEDVKAIARLACLRVEDDELDELTGRFNAILHLFDQLGPRRRTA